MKKLIIILAVVLFALFFISDKGHQRTVDWTPTYSRLDKNPYGCFILYNEWKQLFPNKQLEPIKTSIYSLLYDYDNDHYYDNYDGYYFESDLSKAVETWYDAYQKDDETFARDIDDLQQNQPELLTNDSASNFVFIAEMCSLNDRDSREILKHIIKGNSVFMAANSFSINFPYLNTLKTKPGIEGADSTQLILNGTSYNYKKASVNHFFDYEEHQNIEVLAENDKGLPVLLKVSYGKGTLILSSTPLAFTNYHILLNNNHNYIAQSLSELPIENAWWCGNYLEYDYDKMDSPYDMPENDRSILQFIHSQPALTWAFYMLLCGLLLFFALATKRKQRRIPTYNKPVNTSVEFTNTISRLYLRQQDHKDIGEKMITYFFEEIRSKYYLNPHQPPKDFEVKLSEKSGVELEEVVATFKFIELFQQKKSIHEQDIAKLNKHIQNFKYNSH